MSTYSQIAWLPLTGGLTLAGLIASFFVWRRRGAAAGLRGAAWSLLPLAAYLVGVIELIWRFGVAIGSFAASFVFSPRVWAGLIVVGVAAVLFAVSAGMRRGRARKQTAAGGGNGQAGRLVKAEKAGKPAKAVKGKDAKQAEEEFGDVADILRRHGIG